MLTFSDYSNIIIWVPSSETVPSNVRNMRRFSSSCAYANYDPGLCSPLIHFMVSSDSVSEHVKAPICGCAGWSGPLLSAYARRHVFTWRRPTWAFAVRICAKTPFRPYDFSIHLGNICAGAFHVINDIDWTVTCIIKLNYVRKMADITARRHWWVNSRLKIWSECRLN